MRFPKLSEFYPLSPRLRNVIDLLDIHDQEDKIALILAAVKFSVPPEDFDITAVETLCEMCEEYDW